MPKPIAICIEDLDAQPRIKYLRCVALPGRQPGLRLDEAGRVLWQSDDGVSCELWVSADERLILYRPAARAPVTLHRAGRSLDVPCGKPVVVVDQDQVDVGSRRLRIHVHGHTSTVAAPSPLPARSRPFGRLAQAAATAAVIGAFTTAGGCTIIDIIDNPPEVAAPTIEVIENPPEPVIQLPTASADQIPIAEVIQGEWTAAQAYDVEDERVWITGTLTIEGNAYTFTPAREITGTSVQGKLDFLFDHPTGEVIIDYGEATPDVAFEYFYPGDIFAVCVFRADSVVVGEFRIQVGDSNSLHFYIYNPSGEDDLWSVTKQLGAD